MKSNKRREKTMTKLYRVQYKNAYYYLVSDLDTILTLLSHQPKMTYEEVKMTDADELANCILDIC